MVCVVVIRGGILICGCVDARIVADLGINRAKIEAVATIHAPDRKEIRAHA
jgi:hypothetical protein